MNYSTLLHMSVTKSVGCIKDALNGQWFPYFLRFAAKQTTSQAQTALEEVGVGTARTLGSKTQRRIHSPAQPSIIDHYRASIILTTWPRRKTGQILMTFFFRTSQHQQEPWKLWLSFNTVPVVLLHLHLWLCQVDPAIITNDPEELDGSCCFVF